MEQKPIKRNEHILQLSRDHHFTLLFSWKLVQGVKNKIESERIKKYVDYFWHNDMQAHFREEEEILFPLIKGDQVEKAALDHEQIKKQVYKILSEDDQEQVYKYLTSLADLIITHVRYEERVLFPYLEQILTGMQLEYIGEQLGKQPVLSDTYEDEFWIRKK
jgi:iron-sulfur cluster repair protein YtfE (RIC family)